MPKTLHLNINQIQLFQYIKLIFVPAYPVSLNLRESKEYQSRKMNPEGIQHKNSTPQNSIVNFDPNKYFENTNSTQSCNLANASGNTWAEMVL